jgi:hypothetical protein
VCSLVSRDVAFDTEEHHTRHASRVQPVDVHNSIAVAMVFLIEGQSHDCLLDAKAARSSRSGIIDGSGQGDFDCRVTSQSS